MTVEVGDVVELRLLEGYAYGVVVLRPAAYPPAIAFLNSISSEPVTDPVDALLRGRTVTALVPLPLGETDGLRIVGHIREVPEVRFRLPVRDRTGKTLYFWEWDGQSIELGDDAQSQQLPERRILPRDELAVFLGVPRSKSQGPQEN